MNSAILIPSCDSYADVWPIFFANFFKYWPDCPFPIYLGSNQLTFDHPLVKNISIGEDDYWTANLSKFLSIIDPQQVILILDDFIFYDYVQNHEIVNLLNIKEEYSVSCIRLRPSPPPSKPIAQFHNLGEIQKGDPYRISTQIAIWDTQYLLAIAALKMNIWQFEEIGSLISDRLPGVIWGANEPILHYKHVIERGEWLPFDQEMRKSDDGLFDLSKRKIKQEISSELISKKNLMPFIIKKIPIKYRRLIRRSRIRFNNRSLILNGVSLAKEVLRNYSS